MQRMMPANDPDELSRALRGETDIRPQARRHKHADTAQQPDKRQQHLIGHPE